MLRALGLAALALVLAPPAHAGTFSAPVRIGTGGGQGAVIAADGSVIGWNDIRSVHVLADGRDASVGATQGGPIAVARDPAGRPLLAWTGQDGRAEAWDSGVAGNLDGLPGMTRSMGATPWLVAWMVQTTQPDFAQIARLNAVTQRFGAAERLDPLGRPTPYSLSVAGDATGRAVLAWHAADDSHASRRRIVLVCVRADGSHTGSRCISDVASVGIHPSVAMSGNGTAVVAWQDNAAGDVVRLREIASDCTPGPTQTLADSAGSLPPTAAAGQDGTFAVAWRNRSGAIMATLKRPSGSFGTPALLGWTAPGYAVTASVDAAGDVVVAWGHDSGAYVTAAPPGGRFGAGTRLSTTPASGVAAGGRTIVWQDPDSGTFFRSQLLMPAGPPALSGGRPGTLPRQDRTSPRVRLRIHGSRLMLRCNEPAVAMLRHGRQRLTTRLRPAVTKRIRLQGNGRSVTLRVADVVGNTTVLRRALHR